MAQDRYIQHVLQTNGCRIWENPNKSYSKPKDAIEIFISNLPEHMFEVDILPLFERFGEIYQFRLLIDYGNQNRGFAYLIYYYEKSALACLDLMGYHIITPGVVMLDVQRSQERSHLQALNIPWALSNAEIATDLQNLYKEVCSVHVVREASVCSAILQFKDHSTALNAKRWSGIGSVNLWGRNIKILWAPADKVEEMSMPSHEAKHVLAHNVPERFDVQEFGFMMYDYVTEMEIISIRPMNRDWLIQFSSQQAAHTIFSKFNGITLAGETITTEWVSYERLKKVLSFGDFDFELRCLCLANFWDPPIFIYGRIIATAKTQLCAVIIKNNHDLEKNFTTFLMEIQYEGLAEIHARVCEVLVRFLMQLKELPKQNVVIECSNKRAIIVGEISDLQHPKMVPTGSAIGEQMFLFQEEIYALGKMSFQLIVCQKLDDIYKEYNLILKSSNISHQFIRGIRSEQYILGCIDPIYRRGKPLKYMMMDSRHMILAMCDVSTNSNCQNMKHPSLRPIRADDGKKACFKVEKVEFTKLSDYQSQEFHFTYRPFIQFKQVDTFGALKDYNCMMKMQQHQLQAAADYLLPVGSKPPAKEEPIELNMCSIDSTINVHEFVENLLK